MQAGNTTHDGDIDNPRGWLHCADSKNRCLCRYDAGGFNNLQQSDLDFEVDLSQLGMVNTAMAAMFSKLGEALIGFSDSALLVAAIWRSSALLASAASYTVQSSEANPLVATNWSIFQAERVCRCPYQNTSGSSSTGGSIQRARGG